MAFCLLDIDHFKLVNDSHGHQMGDTALRCFAQAVRARLRGSDVFGRMGGEEFGLVLPATDAAGAARLAEGVRAAVEAMELSDAQGRRIALTVSAGVVVAASDSGLSATRLYMLADGALYRARTSGATACRWRKIRRKTPARRRAALSRAGTRYRRRLSPATSPDSMTVSSSTSASAALQVRRLHQILLWPLRLMPLDRGEPGAPRRPWELLAGSPDSRWRELVDEYTGGAENFHERHYQEFVTFLPLCSASSTARARSRLHAGDASAESAMKVYRRHDVKGLRLRLREGGEALSLSVIHVDLYSSSTWTW